MEVLSHGEELSRELRAVGDLSKKRPKLTFQFLSRHIRGVSGLTLREGSKYLPDEQRKMLLRRRR